MAVPNRARIAPDILETFQVVEATEPATKTKSKAVPSITSPLAAAHILELAPDVPNRKAGQDQAKAAKWIATGRAGTVIWGEIKGSGVTTCKHALRLMLVDAASPLPEGTPPDWAEDWAKAREFRATQGRLGERSRRTGRCPAWPARCELCQA